ncbi:zf-HC2 domain-containing protein [Paenibacillus filicis]|uniref:Anti-sigma-W factor RsiW n=1 Tax=Paenibacillus filicis TaxID=669464 RepID=A0ABU9DSN0_9BACL
MNISCAIIKDLLPLYHDGVCSNETKAMVEEHLAACDSCKAELQAMDDELPMNQTEQNLKEAEAVQNLSRRWKKGMLQSLLKGVFIAITTIAIVLLVLYVFVDVKVVPKA